VIDFTPALSIMKRASQHKLPYLNQALDRQLTEFYLLNIADEIPLATPHNQQIKRISALLKYDAFGLIRCS